jgi:hypothetical protein
MFGLVFFDENPLLLDAVRSAVGRTGVATVRRVLMEWRVMRMREAVDSDMDAVFAFVNCSQHDDAWDALEEAFPTLRKEAAATCHRMGLPPARRRAGALGHTICVDVGRGPLVVIYGAAEAGTPYEGFSAMLRLAPEHCTIGIPCVGNVFGTCTTAREVIDGLMRALDDSIRAPCGGISDGLCGQ